jgi:aminomethyltransferase
VSSQISPEVYKAAHEAAVLVDRSNLGLLKFTGATRLDLLNRMSTQAVNGLKSGEGAATILTTDIGRIIDRLILYTSSQAVYALTGENNGDNIARYLMRFVFFNDDFHIERLSEQTAIFAIYGPQAKSRLIGAGFTNVDLSLHHWRQCEVAGVTAYLHRTDPVAGDGYFVMCETADKEKVGHHLLDSGLILADEAAFEFLRIESGLPRFGREITQDYIPLEANLWDDVSFSKGCYIGQEIIARMESRGQLAKKLVQLQPVAPVEVGVKLQSEGKMAGTVTSAAVGPNGAVALGYVKTSMLEGKVIAGETPVFIRNQMIG